MLSKKQNRNAVDHYGSVVSNSNQKGRKGGNPKGGQKRRNRR